MTDWMKAIAAREARAAEIGAMRIAAALARADERLDIERKGSDVRVVGRGLLGRMLHEPALRFARRFGR